MSRQREYDRDDIIRAAQDAFWNRGYEASDLNVLEEATQLSRSSIYLAFGSKRGLFDEAISDYWSTVTESLIGPLEAKDATPAAAANIFVAFASMFRGEMGSRGCLITNAIGEMARHDAGVVRQGADLYERYCVAFTNALTGGTGRRSRDRRMVIDHARVLAAATMGVWITSRVDPEAAAQACDALVKQIKEWTHPTKRRTRS